MSKPVEGVMMDPLDAWLEDLYERAALFEYDAGMSRPEAEAWADMHVTQTRGPRPPGEPKAGGPSASIPDPAPKEPKPRRARPSARSRR